MIEIFKTLIERLLSWPVSAFVLCMLFKKPLGELLDRVVLVKAPGIEFSAPSGSANKQLVADKAVAVDALVTAPPTQDDLLPEDIEKKREMVLAYGGNTAILHLQMGSIETNLVSLQFAMNDEQTVKLLIRHLAMTQLLYKAENLYRLSFGSQIRLLEFVNERGPQTESTIRPIFEAAKAKSPKFFSRFTFENWLSFLVQNEALASEDGHYGISVFGMEFLGWVNSVGAGKKAH